MKNRGKSFGFRLWSTFTVFAAVIFAVLWLLQTVLLQRFYTEMAVSGLKKTAWELAEQKDEAELTGLIEEAAQKNSLLIFVTNEAGDVLYSADEYSSLYDDFQSGKKKNSGKGNPYLSDKGLLNWEKGVIRNLPYSHTELIEKLLLSEKAGLGYTTEDGAAYVYGVKLENCMAFDGEDAVMCISMPLGSVDGTVGILGIQLLWVSVLSLLLTFLLAYFLARKFSEPIRSITEQAKSIAAGRFCKLSNKGFCIELDELSDTLNETAASLERLERSRRELLANISHDLRTPLTMIRGYAEIVREISWNDEEKRSQDLNVIIREADRLTALVGEILEYSSMQSLYQKPEMEEFDLSEAVRNVICQFDALCREQGFIVEQSVAPGLWIRGNRTQLERVIYNFIDNAVNHTDNSRRISVSLCVQGDRVRFAVQDFGAGIPDDEIPYIWDRYYTSRNRKNKAAVSGLGLSIAKEILTMHGMRFGVECTEGCVFWFEAEKTVKAMDL